MNAISRRDLMKRALLAGSVPALGLLEARAAELLPLDAQDATAQALGFINDASKVDASANPSFKPGQHCGACSQFQGRPTDARAECAIFGGKSVPYAGWCRVWSQRPA